MNAKHPQYLSNRVLRQNVGFLLNAGLGTINESQLSIPDPVRVDDDLILDAIKGPLRLTRTKEGVLVQATFDVLLELQCTRCLEFVQQHVQVSLEELYAYPNPNIAEFHIAENGMLDLSPLLRAETIIAVSGQVLCKPDCLGLCPECGTNRNHNTCDCETDNIDPRLAILKNLLDSE